MEKINSKIEYKKGYIIQDNTSKIVYKVVSCKKVNYGYSLEIKKHYEYLEDLKNALNTIKLHDKDLFMLQNIVDSLEDSLNG